MRKTIAALIAGLVLGAAATGLAASRAQSGFVYPGQPGSEYLGLDLSCTYLKATARNPRVLSCIRPSTNAKGIAVFITARKVEVVDTQTRTLLYQHARNP
jgi:hypothetical protein